MIPAQVREAVDQLLAAVDEHPTVLPVAALHALRETGLDVDIDRRSVAPVVYVRDRIGVDVGSLTDREREVAMLAVAGFANRQIAHGLGISLHTVKDHMHAVLHKTGLASRSQLIAAWYGGLRAGFGPPGESVAGGPSI